MEFILNFFKNLIHSLPSSLSSYNHISHDLGLERRNTDLPITSTFNSSNLNVIFRRVLKDSLEGVIKCFRGIKDIYAITIFKNLKEKTLTLTYLNLLDLGDLNLKKFINQVSLF